MQRNLPLVTEDNIADLLHVVCNSTAIGAGAAVRLMEEATERFQVLAGSTVDQQHLAYDLLQTCLARGHVDAVMELLTSPAAQSLGEHLLGNRG